jgi:RNA polymerase sigma factor (sigma-70 family)
MVDWQAILAKHRTRMWRVVYRLLGHYDDALDCCQEALLDAHEFALKEEVAEWGSLLVTLGTRRAIDRLRKRISQRKFEVPLENVAEPGVDVGGPIQAAEAAELFEKLRRLVTALPDKQAEVFWLVCVEGLSNAEVGRQLAITPNEARVLVHRARTHLAKMLNIENMIARKKR